MAEAAIPFSASEAHKLQRRSVRLMKAMGAWPAGTTGDVTDYQDFLYGYMVQVTWHGPLLGRVINFEYFTKDDFDEYLVEC